MIQWFDKTPTSISLTCKAIYLHSRLAEVLGNTVNLGYDADQRLICIKPTSTDDPNGFAVRDNTTQYLINCKYFIDSLNLNLSTSKACDIPQKVREAVYERDNGICAICKMAPGAPNMHFIPRGAGGLGIVENIVCGCAECHRVYDNGYHKDINMRDYYGGIIREHLDEHYPGFPDEKRFYNRWEDLK